MCGTLLPEYVAVTGDDTNTDLKHVCKRPRKSGSLDPVLFGVTTGNWITLDGGNARWRNTAIPSGAR